MDDIHKGRFCIDNHDLNLLYLVATLIGHHCGIYFPYQQLYYITGFQPSVIFKCTHKYQRVSFFWMCPSIKKGKEDLHFVILRNSRPGFLLHVFDHASNIYYCFPWASSIPQSVWWGQLWLYRMPEVFMIRLRPTTCGHVEFSLAGLKRIWKLKISYWFNFGGDCSAPYYCCTFI